MEPNNSGVTIESSKTSKKVLHKLKKFLVVAVGALTVIGLAAIGINTYRYSNPPKNLDDIKLIRGNIGPVRVEPLDPGGARFSFQDKLVYKNLEEQVTSSISDETAEITMKEKVELRGVNKPQQTKSMKATAKTESKANITEPIKTKRANNPFELLNE